MTAQPGKVRHDKPNPPVSYALAVPRRTAAHAPPPTDLRRNLTSPRHTRAGPGPRPASRKFQQAVGMADDAANATTLWPPRPDRVPQSTPRDETSPFTTPSWSHAAARDQAR